MFDLQTKRFEWRGEGWVVRLGFGPSGGRRVEYRRRLAGGQAWRSAQTALESTTLDQGFKAQLAEAVLALESESAPVAVLA
jgi:hypothetical protein